jgi:hypothetical protein
LKPGACADRGSPSPRFGSIVEAMTSLAVAVARADHTIDIISDTCEKQ